MRKTGVRKQRIAVHLANHPPASEKQAQHQEKAEHEAWSIRPLFFSFGIPLRFGVNMHGMRVAVSANDPQLARCPRCGVRPAVILRVHEVMIGLHGNANLTL